MNIISQGVKYDKVGRPVTDPEGRSISKIIYIAPPFVLEDLILPVDLPFHFGFGIKLQPRFETQCKLKTPAGVICFGSESQFERYFQVGD